MLTPLLLGWGGILVVGAGEVLARRLAAANRRVAAFVGRDEHSRAVPTKGGIGLIPPGEKKRHQSVAAYSSAEDYPGRMSSFSRISVSSSYLPRHLVAASSA